MNKEERLAKDLRFLTSEIVSNIPGITTLILCGGYGRDEGSWIIDDNGEASPYNDYDFIAITDQHIDYQELGALRKELAKQIGISWIDIDILPKKNIPHLKSTIKNIDTIKASKVLYGNLNDFNLCRELSEEKIGFYDIKKLFYTRMWTFMGGLKSDYFQMSISDITFFRNQMAKAILAGCDVILIKNGLYTPSYIERVKKVCQINISEEFKVAARWAVAEKMEPSQTKMSLKEIDELYNSTHKHYIYAMKYAMGWRWKVYSNPIFSYWYQLLTPSYLMRLVYNLIFRRNFRYDYRLRINIVQALMFFSYRNKNNECKLIKKVKKILASMGYQFNEEESWDEMRSYVACIRNEV